MNYIARRHQRDRGLMVALEGWAVPVIAIAIRFHDHPLAGPEEVNKTALYQHVHLGRRQASLATECQEVDLKRRDGVHSARIDLLRYAAQAPRPPSPDALRTASIVTSPTGSERH